MTRSTTAPEAPFVSRRAAPLGLGAAGSAAFLGMRTAHGAPSVRSIAMTNLHTGERLSADYWIEGRYENDALAEINTILRDHRTGEVAEMRPELIDLLWKLHHATGTGRNFHIISGYRSPKTNAMLAADSNGVAKKSFHMRGMAIDCALPDVPLKTLHRATKTAKAGGVGAYPKSGFVHVDVGPVRYW